MSPEEITFYQDVAKRLDSAPYGKKGRVIDDVVKATGDSTQLIYDKLKQVGYESGRKTRADRGDTHVDLQDARLVCNMIYNTRRRNEKRLLSFDQAIEIAYTNGKIQHHYNSTTLSRVARDHGFHPDQLSAPTPHVMMRSKHPNHVWQVDASIGVLFYLEKGGVQFFDEKVHYKNKPENIEKVRKHLCVRYVVVDHYSGALYVKYYAAAGETQEIMFDVLANSFIKRDSQEMHGVPTILVMDKGAANTSHLVTRFLDRMEIINYAHGVGNSRAKGSVEKAQDIVERNFEAALRLTRKRVTTVDELNDLATRWMIFFNGREIHTRTKKTRDEVWRTIEADQLRIAPSMETMQAILSSKPVERRVRGDLTITFKGKGFDEYLTYSVEHVPHVKVRDLVTVSINPYRAPNINIEVADYKGQITLYESSPIEINEAGFYADAPVIGEEMHTAPDTITDIYRKEMLKEAYGGANTLVEAKDKEKQGVQLFGGEIDPFLHVEQHIEAQQNVLSIPKRGTAHGLDAPKQVFEKITIAAACTRIKGVLGDQYPKDTYQYLSKKYPDGIDPLDIEAIAQSLIKRPVLKVVGE